MTAATLATLILILDFSGSMDQKIGKRTKRETLIQSATTLQTVANPNSETSVFYFGTSTKNSCLDVKSENVQAKNFKKWIKNKRPAPQSKTPLALTLEKVKDQITLIPKDDHRLRQIIVITDGADTCGGHICKMIGEIDALLFERKIGRMRFDVLGYDLNSHEKNQMECNATHFQSVEYHLQYPKTEKDFAKRIIQARTEGLKEIAQTAPSSTVRVKDSGVDEEWTLTGQNFKTTWKSELPKQVPPGTYTISSSRPGTPPRQITVIENQPLELEFHGELPDQPTNKEVTSTPASPVESKVMFTGSVIGFTLAPKKNNGPTLTIRTPSTLELEPGDYALKVMYPSWLDGKINTSIQVKEGEQTFSIDQILEGKLLWLEPEDPTKDQYLDLQTLGVTHPLLVPAGTKIPVPKGTIFKWIQPAKSSD